MAIGKVVFNVLHEFNIYKTYFALQNALAYPSYQIAKSPDHNNLVAFPNAAA